MLRLHDTAQGQVVDFTPREPGKVSMYVCGPTVYDHPHIGHGRQVLVYDVLWRYLEWSGLEVTFASNVTDIDDNIIKRANEEGRSTEDVVATYEAAYWNAVDGLGVRRPTHTPHATEYVDHMIQLISELEEAGIAYTAPDGVYFSTEAVPGYGLLAEQSLESLRAGARIEVGEGKRSPIDFVLWKLSKPGEPSWDAPWGAGRPGWHTECVVMSLDLLGEGFDLHSGGLDLKFPHHENERAQAVALGKTFSRHWMHHAFVEIGGVKMSKSLKNFTSLTDLLERTGDGRTYRLLVLQSHYRSPMEVTTDSIEQAANRLAGLDAFARRFADGRGASADTDVIDRFREAMDDDLDTPRVMALVSDLVRQANAEADAGRDATSIAASVFEMTTALGLELRSETDEIDAQSQSLVDQRDAARAAKDFARADALRDELKSLGWNVEDTPEGTRIHR
ncbi:MAG: cysteine--tRNA ligase [Actinobacteria bacterium]|nr:cysteine--tRNA ligase [Actinomycetota bacterium]